MPRAALTRLRLHWPVLLLAGMSFASPAAADKVRITQLTDVNFGVVGALEADSRRSQSICVYSNGQSGTYSVSASGSGPGSAFALANGPYLLDYDVEWSALAGQAGGATLIPNVALTGLTTAATNQQCSSGPSASATLTLVLRGARLAAAREGNYGGSLTIIIGAE